MTENFESEINEDDSYVNGEKSSSLRENSFSVRNWLIGIFVLSIFGFLLYHAITGSRVFYLNVDEAIEQKDDLGSDTFRIQGIVGTDLDRNEDNFNFSIEYNDAVVNVAHIGQEPSDLFSCGQNVVAEGSWSGDEFVSRQILVKHSEDYLDENPERAEEIELKTACENDVDI